MKEFLIALVLYWKIYHKGCQIQYWSRRFWWNKQNCIFQVKQLNWRFLIHMHQNKTHLIFMLDSKT